MERLDQTSDATDPEAMTANSLLLLETSFKGIAAVFAVVMAYLLFLERQHTDTDDLARVWFRDKWVRVNQSSWLDLPKRCIKWFFNQKTFLIRLSVYQARAKRTSKLAYYELVVLSILFSLYIEEYKISAVLAAYYILFQLFLTFLKYYTERDKKEATKTGSDIHSVDGTASQPSKFLLFTVAIFLFLLIFFPFVSVVSVLVITVGILKLNIYFATVFTVILLPMYWRGIGLPTIMAVGVYKLVQMIRNRDFEALTKMPEDEELRSRFQYKMSTLQSFAIGVSFSFVVTILALLIGHVGSPESWIPMTMQMLISNLLFDGFTMVATFWLLGWYLQKQSFMKLPAIIVIDIVACAVLACLSLYFALIFTDQELTFNEIIRVLIALSPNKSGYVLGPYFWVMHSTFLPTLIYLTILLICWLGKGVAVFVVWFLSINAVNDKPMALTGALFGVLTAVFYVVGIALEQAKKLL